MSWKFPRRIPKTGQILDAQDLDDAFVPYVDEEGGHLGEQNFSSSLANDLIRETDLAPDICMRVATAQVVVDASEGPTSVPTPADEPFTQNALAQQVTATGTWVPIEGLSYTFTSKGGTLYALASMQLGVTFPKWDGPTDNNIITMRLGIRVDGAVYPILTIGDQDSYDEGDFMELGVGGWCQGVDVEGSIPITPGSHTVDFVISAHVVLARGFGAPRDIRGEVLTRELIALEIG